MVPYGECDPSNPCRPDTHGYERLIGAFQVPDKRTAYRDGIASRLSVLVIDIDDGILPVNLAIAKRGSLYSLDSPRVAEEVHEVILPSLRLVRDYGELCMRANMQIEATEAVRRRRFGL